MSALLDVRQDGSVLHLTLNDTARRNALSQALLLSLEEAQERIAPDVRVVVLGATGPVFSSGHDLRDIAGADESAQQELFGLCTRVMLGFRALPLPVVAKVQGLATAAGCQLALSCDLVLASEGAAFATPGVRIGLFCTTPMVPLVRAVPEKVAMEMLMTGRPLSAHRALELGVINQVMPQGELDDAVATLCQEFMQVDAGVLASGKRSFYDVTGRSETASYELATPRMACDAAGPAAQAGIERFLNRKR